MKTKLDEIEKVRRLFKNCDESNHDNIFADISPILSQTFGPKPIPNRPIKSTAT
jgi:hypothetical protein